MVIKHVRLYEIKDHFSEELLQSIILLNLITVVNKGVTTKKHVFITSAFHTFG